MVDMTNTNPVLQKLCDGQDKMAQGLAQMAQALTAMSANIPSARPKQPDSTKPHHPDDGSPCCDSCAAGGTCESECPGTPIAFALPECYKGCRTISRCLMAFFRDARLRTDSAAWLEYNKRESPLVHINQSIGNAPNYQANVVPIASNTNVMLMQERSQWLPYEPGFFKLDATWTGPEANANVVVRIYTGDYGITSVTTTPGDAGLVQIGPDFTLADFTVSKDAGGGCCWFMPYPELFGCEEPAIPNMRRVFIELRAGALGQSQITAFSITLVKRYSKRFFALCKQYNIEL